MKARNYHVSRWELIRYPVAVWSTRALHGGSRNISPKSKVTDSYVDSCRIPLGQMESNSIHRSWRPLRDPDIVAAHNAVGPSGRLLTSWWSKWCRCGRFYFERKKCTWIWIGSRHINCIDPESTAWDDGDICMERFGAEDSGGVAIYWCWWWRICRRGYEIWKIIFQWHWNEWGQV